MLNPYFLMTALYVVLATLMALNASLINFEWIVPIAGLRWLRVHFITLGALTEFTFGFLPLLLAMRHNLPRPKVRRDIWMLLNLGLLILMVGVPQISANLMTAGGTLIFIAAVLLIIQLWQLRGIEASGLSSGRWFYITGILYLLFGIIIGTGLWQPWLTWFQMKVPIEVHIHANNWGFMSLVFAGLLVDMYPKFSGHELAWPQSVKTIFWMMSSGALLLVLAPWTGLNILLAPIGIILHLGSTFWLLANVIKPLWGTTQLWQPGMLHIVSSYTWIILPVLFAPLVILDAGGLASAGIEQNAPQALIYGWVLQFAFAMLPLAFRRIFQPQAEARLGGNWFSFAAVHLGAIIFWSSIFLLDMRADLQGVAYGLWMLAMLPIVWELWLIVRDSPQDEPDILATAN
jgi:hypothetical protein